MSRSPRIPPSLRRLNVEENRKRRRPALLLLQQEPAGRQEADRRAHRLHLRRVRRHLPRHHRRGPGPRDPGPRDQASQAQGDQGVPRRLRDRAGAGQEEARRGGLQPLQADRLPGEEPQARRGAPEIEHPPDRADGDGQDPPRPDPGQAPVGPVHDRGRDHPDGGRLRRRGRREHHPQALPGRRQRQGKDRARASSTSTRSTRSPARARTRRSPATSRARASSRRC